MKPPASEVAIWERLLVPKKDKLSPQKARLILELRFQKRDIQRMHELSAKSRAGKLTRKENEQMEVYERVGHLVSILKSYARQVLKDTRPGS